MKRITKYISAAVLALLMALAFAFVLTGCPQPDGSGKKPSESTFTAVTNITGIPSYKQTTTDLTLNGTVVPSDATNKTIVWSINSAGTTGATVTGNALKTTATGTVVVTATIANGATETTAYTQNFTISVVDEIPAFVAVTNITGVPTQAVVGVDLTLTGTVVPADATNKTIAWSINSAGTTGATITNGVFKATAAGTATVTATITNGATATTNYTKNFTINVTAPLNPGENGITVNFTAITDETINLGDVNALSTGGNITVTVTGSYTSYEWYIDGEKAEGATNQIVITGSSLKSGPHTVTAIVEKDATPYSKVLNFTK
jgi:endo-1,4-beta-xylanase